ncbi:MAG TPA: hypothetical protein VFT59_00555, partial [Candidatus Saccharimonadales bacterium]|nr:hypothetical protein [Candidatus Saccharimonadales bacterium]
MAKTDPRPNGERCYGEDFLRVAYGLGYEDESAVKRVWRRIITLVKGAEHDKELAFTEYATLGQLREVLGGGRLPWMSAED